MSVGKLLLIKSNIFITFIWWQVIYLLLLSTFNDKINIMENLQVLEKTKKPNLEVRITQKNTLKHFGYYSFEERVFDLSSLFKKSLDKKYTQTIGANTYVSREFETDFGNDEIIFNGVYKLAPIEKYMGFIPESNQKEIDSKFKSLINNPFLKQNFKLLVLAPLNNFAEENNITAIDPIAFAYFEEGEHCYKKNFLITLSQWI